MSLLDDIWRAQTLAGQAAVARILEGKRLLYGAGVASRKSRLEAMEEVDSSVFSSDMLFNPAEIAEFRGYLDRWNKAVSEHTPIPDDGTCGMCHGTGEGQGENSFCPNCRGTGIA